MPIDLDHHDHRILAELQADARLTMAELGRRVHLSQPAVTERVRKLEEGGVIRGYRAIVDGGQLGYAIRAVIRSRPWTNRRCWRRWLPARRC
jgi:Lrp/AsnC family leucine-responsive transcriptional regulator